MTSMFETATVQDLAALTSRKGPGRKVADPQYVEAVSKATADAPLMVKFTTDKDKDTKLRALRMAGDALTPPRTVRTAVSVKDGTKRLVFWTVDKIVRSETAEAASNGAAAQSPAQSPAESVPPVKAVASTKK